MQNCNRISKKSKNVSRIKEKKVRGWKKIGLIQEYDTVFRGKNKRKNTICVALN